MEWNQILDTIEIQQVMQLESEAKEASMMRVRNISNIHFKM